MSKHPLIIILSLLFCFQISHAESGPDNGTDYVKVLFAQAQTQVKESFESLEQSDIDALEVEASLKSWLLQNREGKSQWRGLQFYLASMRLSFQAAPCEDSLGRKASICYFDENPQDPYVVISVNENKNTTLDQAMAMLIHEAGHFVGEKDHLFMDQLGTQLVQAFQKPKFFSLTLESTETVSNVFQAKEECEQGTSAQAHQLRQEAELKLQEMCHQRNQSCDFKKALLVFKGTSVFEPGVGFTMKVNCQLKLGYKL